MNSTDEMDAPSDTADGQDQGGGDEEVVSAWSHPTPSVAEGRKLRAEADKYEAEAALARARARTEQIAAEHGQILLDRTHREERSDLARDHYHHRLFVRGEIDHKWAGTVIGTLSDWMRNSPGCDMELVFYSGGGSLLDGFAIWDAIQMARRAGHRVVTSTIGYAFSMAAVLLQAGDERVAYSQSSIMLHEAAFTTAGKLSFVEDQVDWVKSAQERILDIFADRSKLSRAQIKNRYTRKEWFMSAREALSFGLVDTVI